MDMCQLWSTAPGRGVRIMTKPSAYCIAFKDCGRYVLVSTTDGTPRKYHQKDVLEKDVAKLIKMVGSDNVEVLKEVIVTSDTKCRLEEE